MMLDGGADEDGGGDGDADDNCRGDEDWGGDAAGDHGDNKNKNSILECSFSVRQYFRIVYSHLFKSCSNME